MDTNPCGREPITAEQAEQMAMDIIDVLDQTPEAEYTHDELLLAAGYDPVKYRIPRRVRRLFTEALARTGFFVPPSVPSLGFTIFSTKNPEKLYDAMLHIMQITHGMHKLLYKMTDYVVRNKEWAAANPGAAMAVSVLHRSSLRFVEDSEFCVEQLDRLVTNR